MGTAARLPLARRPAVHPPRSPLLSRDFRHVLDALQAGVVVLDSLARVEEINAPASRFLELPLESVMGAPVERLAGADHAMARLARTVLVSGLSAQESDLRIERRHDTDVVVDVAASPLFDARGDPNGAVLVLRDRTLQKRVLQLESERERFSSIGQMATGLAHEIKNPLGGIRGAAELLARRAADEKGREIAELIVRESTRIAKLVDDLTVFARTDDLRLRTVNVHEVLDGVIALLSLDAQASHTQVERSFDPSLPEFLADADRLTQVFLNLGRNAVQAMEKTGGKLTVTTRVTLDHRVTTPEGRLVPTLAVWFEDDGPGMPEDVLRQATTPFFTKRVGGTGLGLAVADYWTARHGGVLHLTSEVGKGTRVRVTLPLRRSEEPVRPRGEEAR
jgi:two-component system nitrogen regulation sensor histidine kinase GlnL